MDAAKKSLTSDLLKDFTPLKGLAPERFAEVVEKINIHDVAIGRYLFKHGERDNNTYFVIKGIVALLDHEDVEIASIKGGSKDALEALAPKQPRTCSARVTKTATIATIGTNLLEVLIGSDSLSGFAVGAIDEGDDDDWMSLMLRSRVFQKLPPVNISRLITGMEPASLRAGEKVFSEGDNGDCCYTIKSGRCKVSRSGAGGKEAVLAELGVGDSFGEDALLSDAKRGATITMLTDGVLMKLPKKAFLELLNQPLATDTTYEEAVTFINGGAKWLDVRTAEEYQAKHIAGSISMTYATLRDNVNSLEPGITYIVCCNDGHLSNAATFFLNQKGIDARVLSGGLNSVPVENSARAADVIPIVKSPTPPNESPERAADGADAVPKKTYKKAVEARLNAEKELLKIKTAQTRIQQMLHGETEARGNAEREVARLTGEFDALKQAQADARENTAVTAARIEQQARNSTEKLTAELAAVRADLDGRSQALAKSEQNRGLLEREIASLTRRLSETEGSSNDAATRLRSELGELTAKLRGATDKLDAAIGEKTAAVTSSRRIEAELGDLKRQLDATAKGGEAMAAQIQQAEQAKRTAVEATERLRAELDALQRQSQLDREAHDKELANRQRELKQVVESQASTSQHATDAQARAEKLEHEISELRQTTDAARRDVDAAGTELVRVQQALDDANSHSSALEREIADLRKSAEGAQHDAKTSGTELVKIRQDLDDAQRDSTGLRDEVASLTRQLGELASKRTEAEQGHNSLQKEAEELRDRLERTSTEHKEATRQHAAENQALETELTNSRTAIDQLQQDKRQADAKTVSLQQTVNELAEGSTKAANGLASTIQQLESQRDQLSKQLGDTQTLAQRHADRIEEIEQQLGIDSRAQTSQTDEIDRLRQELDETRAGSAAAARGADQIQDDINQVRQQLEQTCGERDTARQQLTQAEAKIESLKNEATATDARAGEFASNAERLQGEVDELGARLAAAEQDTRERLERELLSAQEERESARRELAERTAEAAAEISEKRAKLADHQSDAEAIIEKIERESEYKLAKLMREGEELKARLQAQTDKAEALAARDKETTKTLARYEKELVQSEKHRGRLEAAIEKAKQIPSHASTGVTTSVSGRVAKASIALLVIAGLVSGAWIYLGKPLPQALSTAPHTTGEDETNKNSGNGEGSPTADATPGPGPIRSFRDRLVDGDSGPTMIELPAGDFEMGASGVSQNFSERPQHHVTVSRFAISKYEVTFADYDKFADTTGRQRPNDEGRGRGNRPVTRINWHDATAYTDWLSQQTGHAYRLPTEAEWEYAARAGSITYFWWDSDVKPVPANCLDCGGDWDRDGAFTVGKYQANAFGLHDTASNVEEWVQDCYYENYQGAPTDGSARTTSACQERAARGGSFMTTINDLRSSKRSHYTADTRSNRIGFRLARAR